MGFWWVLSSFGSFLFSLDLMEGGSLAGLPMRRQNHLRPLLLSIHIYVSSVFQQVFPML